MRQVIVSHENEGDREGKWVSSVTEGSVLGGRWCQAQMGTLSGGRGAGLRESDAFDWDRTVTVISWGSQPQGLRAWVHQWVTLGESLISKVETVEAAPWRWCED